MQKNRNRRLAASTAGAISIALALSGCGGGESSASGAVSQVADIEITQLDGYTDSTSDNVWQGMLDKCAAETGITVKRQNLPTKEMLPTILRQASSGQLANLIFVDNPNVQQIAATGALVPLEEVGLAPEGMPEGIAAVGSFNGKPYGLAPGVNSLALFYNKTIFEEEGLKPPANWDELKETAKKLTNDGRYGISMALLPTEEGTWQFLPYFWSNGAELTDIASPQAIEALEYVQSLLDDGSMSASVLNWNQAEAGDQFVSGQAAMTVSGSWSVANFDKAGTVEYGIVPLPGPDGPANVALGGEVGIISKSDELHQNAAGKILECMNSKEHQIHWAEEHAYIPAVTEYAEEFGQEHPKMQAFVDAVAVARPRTDDLGADYPATSAALIEAVQETLTGKASAQEALSRAASTTGSAK